MNAELAGRTAETNIRKQDPREARAKRQREAREAHAQHAREAKKAHAQHVREARAAARRKLDEAAGNGLGATKAVFEANNTMISQEGTEPPDGTDYYRITETDSGRVVGYEVTIYASPPFSNRERIGLLGGVDLPKGTKPLPDLEHAHCYVWRSPVLKRLIGKESAEGTTDDGTNSARIEAVSSPNC
jgi:hypothetical protein